jgi:hypothetical protein
MKVKELIAALKKVKDKEASVGFGVWFSDRNWGTGHTIFWDGLSPSEVKVVSAGKGLKVAVVGRADNCLAYTFPENKSKMIQKIEA